ncbi:MAG: DUF554 domain-containing protein [Treponema sp.]|nr:DUF554 domain-containing protein [Treponema sp.]
MLGPVVNALTIIIFSVIGTFLVKGIPDRIEDIIKKAIGLSIVYVGIRGALENENMLLLIMSMVAGSVIGEFINIDKWINRLGQWAEKKLNIKEEADGKRSFSKGFVSATILFCTGSMVIVGSLQSGLEGNHQTLFIKSILDGTISVVFGASFGIGVAFSAIPVLLYEGGIVLFSMAIRDLLSPQMIREMSSVGSLIIAGIGFNFLGVKEIKVANLIPAMFIPCLYFAVIALAAPA